MTESRKTSGLVAPEILDKVAGWRDYVDAKLGFRNYWYPILKSSDLQEGVPVGAKLAGEDLILNRIDGRVYALRDRCLHRGVQMSIRPQCHTKNTITCWYHGFTYRFDTGLLTDVLATPNTRITKMGHHIRRFAVEEAKGLVFVFMGDANRDLPPLSFDVPPGFLDEDLYVLSEMSILKANWRQGVENGCDNTHIVIHRQSSLMRENDLALPLGFNLTEPPGFEVIERKDGPSGVLEHFTIGRTVPVFEGTVEGEVVVKGAMGSKFLPESIGMWLPGALKVDPWPDPSVTSFEWYVPVDETHHIYVQSIGAKVKTEADRINFTREFNQRWKPHGIVNFNGDDVWAREAAERAYADDYNWVAEQLFEPDRNIVAWRKLASRINRGVQSRAHLRD